MVSGAWWATVHGVTKSQTRLSILHSRVVSMIGFSRTSMIFLRLPYLCMGHMHIKVLSVS